MDFAKVCEEVDEMNQGYKSIGQQSRCFCKKNKFQMTNDK